MEARKTHWIAIFIDIMVFVLRNLNPLGTLCGFSLYRFFCSVIIYFLSSILFAFLSTEYSYSYNRENFLGYISSLDSVTMNISYNLFLFWFRKCDSVFFYIQRFAAPLGFLFGNSSCILSIISVYPRVSSSKY